ncbi:MAG: murein biosynthesis integral membrane protein MurJ [Acidobacteriales bacterium]|nr:murein biosynthesis integral membrane protein MurJ [Terriglobales bacterium]
MRSVANLFQRAAGTLHPSREHSVTSAAMLLMAATMLSRVVGYLRDAYVAWAFGAGPITDAYIAAFTLPDFLLYLFAGGSISVTFISLFTRYIAEEREDEAARVYSIIVSVMVAVFVVVIAAGEVYAAEFVRWWFPGFTSDQAALCTWLTRILLPQPVFFLIGGVVSAVQQTRRRFLLPAIAPIVYTVFIILGGVLLSDRMGIASLAVGATAGAFVGPFVLNAIGAHRTGIRYRFSLDISHPGFRQWLWMSIPLMLGVSIVAADDWILRYFASGLEGDITRLNYAKRLLQVPIGVLGQVVGLASLPFFAKLHSEKKFEEFAAAVNLTVSRLGAVCLLATSWMIAAAAPLTFLAFKRGRFSADDSHATAYYFLFFALSLVFWAVQGLYARAFYAAADMWRPMIAGTLITLLSLPVYAALFARYGVIGLVAASDFAIFAHTAVLAVMLHVRGMVRLSGLEWSTLAKPVLAGAIAVIIADYAGRAVPFAATYSSALAHLGFITMTWASAALGLLWVMGVNLLNIRK